MEKQVKPLVLNLQNARSQAEYYFNREFSVVPLEMVKNSEGFFDILRPSDNFLLKEYLSEYADIDKLLAQFYGANVYKDISELKGKKLEEFQEWIVRSDAFSDWKDGDWLISNEPMWGYVFGCPEFYVNSEYMDVDKLKALGIGVIDYDTGYYLYISGAGYDFYDAHWIPLFKALNWIEEVEDKGIECKKEKCFVVGKGYRYSQIPENDTEEYTISTYGLEYLGQNAIHIRYHKTETDVWFIWDGMANEGIFKCVYNK